MDSIDPGSDAEPTRAEIDRLSGLVLVEFGASWCGYCRAIQPQLTALLQQHPAIRHFKIEDGPGLPLGRSFGVKLWPNLVFLRDGTILRQLVRPSVGEIAQAFADLDAKP